MRPEFLRAVVDTLLPGDAGTSPLPSGTSAGVTAKLAERLVAGRDAAQHQVVLRAIADAARGEDGFEDADAAGRVAAVRQVEAEKLGPFQALVSVLLQDYYETERVLLALGWRAEPPQPRGHVMPSFDEALLEPVKRRGRMWRDAP